jgi:hypothetical protein
MARVSRLVGLQGDEPLSDSCEVIERFFDIDRAALAVQIIEAKVKAAARKRRR